jgi:DNA-binding winged helix-turn-helix (wHTH) protein
LLRHPGRLVSKNELLARVWPDVWVERVHGQHGRGPKARV